MLREHVPVIPQREAERFPDSPTFTLDVDVKIYKSEPQCIKYVWREVDELLYQGKYTWPKDRGLKKLLEVLQFPL